MHKSHSLFYLTTALYVSGVTITHLQEHKTTVTTASGNRYTVLLSAAIVEELELFNQIIRLANTGFSAASGTLLEDLRKFYCFWQHKLATEALRSNTPYFIQLTVTRSSSTQTTHSCVYNGTMAMRTRHNVALYKGNSISKLQIQVAT
jgi:hypothetical protein